MQKSEYKLQNKVINTVENNEEKKMELNKIESELISMKNSKKVDRKAAWLINKLLEGIKIYRYHRYKSST